MYLEWTNPAPDAQTTENYRTFVNDFHNKITTAGTNITHMSELSGQFNLVTGVVPSPPVNTTIEGLPLYYKYDCPGCVTLYFTFRFDVYVHTSTSRPKDILGYVAITELLDINGKPSNTKYNNVYNSTSQVNEYYNTSYYYAHNSSDTTFRYSTSSSFLLSKDNGVLVIQYSIGTVNSSAYDLKKPIVSVMVKADETTYTSIALYESDVFRYKTGVINSDTPSYAHNHISRPAVAMCINGLHYNRNPLKNMIMPPYDNIVPIYVLDSRSKFKNITDFYYYDVRKITGSGIISIGDDSFWISGDLIETMSISGADANTALYGFAFKVN